MTQVKIPLCPPLSKREIKLERISPFGRNDNTMNYDTVSAGGMTEKLGMTWECGDRGWAIECAQLIDPFSQSEGFLKAYFPHAVFLE